VPPLSLITSCTPTQSNLHLANSLATVVSAPNIPGTESCVPFPLLRSYQSIGPGPRHVFMFCNIAIFYGEELSAPCRTPKLGDHPCSRLLIQYIRSYRPYWMLFLHLQPEGAPCCGDNVHKTLIWKYCSSTFVAWLVLWEVCFLVYSIIIVFELHINGTQNYFKKCLPVSPCPLSNVTSAVTSMPKECVLFYTLSWNEINLQK